MLAYYSEEDDVPTEKIKPSRIISVGEGPYIVSDDDINDPDQTQPGHVPLQAVTKTFESLKSGNRSAVNAWKELAIKQGFQPNGRYHFRF